MRKNSRWLPLVALCMGLLLAACGGGVATETNTNVESEGVDVATAPETRVKENAGLGSAPALIPAIAEDGPAPRGQTGPNSDAAGVCLNQQEAELAQSINEYRASQNLPALQVSKSLSLVAQQHVWDSNNNQASWPTDPNGRECNLHSWTSVVNPALQQGTWTEVCYTGDHANAEGMWNKPGQVAGFPGQGVENSYAASAGATAAGALLGWQNSPGHNDVILQRSFWPAWSSMGVGVGGNYAHLWVSQTMDPAGEAPLCPGVTVGAPTAEPTAVPPTAVPPTAVPPTPEPTAVPPTAVPPTAEPGTTAEPTAVPPTPEPTAVPPTDVPPTAVPPTDVPPTTAAPTGEILNENGIIAAGATTQHTFPMVRGRTYTIVITPSAEFDVDPRYSCVEGSFTFSGGFDWNWEGVAETFTNTAIGDGSCTIDVTGYQGSTGTYTIVVTAR